MAVAYPFIEIRIDTSALQPIAQRAPGVIAIVGSTNAGTADTNTPYAVDTLAQAAGLFASTDAEGAVIPTTLYNSIQVAMLQDPRPSKIYAVRVNSGNYAAALASLEGADDVTFVALANEVDVGTAPAGAPPTNLLALKAHVENMSSQGQRRIGVAMINPATAKSDSYVDDVVNAYDALKSDSSRMVLIAARGATTDAAVAAMSAIAGFAPHISTVLKRIRGVSMPLESQYSPTEIKELSEENIIPIIDPALIVGESLHFAEGRCFTTDANLLYIDIVRTLDDIEFRLKAGLIGTVGDARITKEGLTTVRTRIEGILGPLRRSAVIVDFAIDIPALSILQLPESTWTATDRSIINTARSERQVDIFVSITYGPAVHLLRVTLAPKF